ncbi:MAG: hypothetical protein JSS49_10615 [Planctomycetes bacterium]|nr:hypothetical protein [Planctomycetota bacterium]
MIERTGGDALEFTRQEQPIIRFTTNGIDEGDIFLWTEQGRPALVGQVFRLKNVEDGLWLHEFQSLSRVPFTLRRAGNELWSPKTKGVEWHTLKTDLVPSESERIRLTQFKQLAREFTGAEQTPGISDGPDLKNFGLTMKPREAFRYQSKPHDVLDGIIFWFTQEENTDPELLLLIEAVPNQKADSWRYALARLSCWPMQINHKGIRVADLPNLLNKTGKSDPYHIWRPALP